MNKDHVFDYNHAFRMKSIIEGLVTPSSSDKDIIVESTSKDSFIRLVYAPDPVSGLPTGDLSYLVSDKANPEVKQWILDNIMIDVSSAKLPAAPDGLSDEDIISLSRDPREDVRSYMERVNKYARNNEDLYERMVAAVREQSGEKQSVSDQSQETSVSSE